MRHIAKVRGSREKKGHKDWGRGRFELGHEAALPTVSYVFVASGETDVSAWKEACASCLSTDKLRIVLTRSLSLPAPLPSGPLDLWSLLFSRSFAALAEDLLRESLGKVLGNLVQRVESVLAVLRAGATYGSLTAHEMSWAGEHMGRGLAKEVQAIAGQAVAGLVQEGDQAASFALVVSRRGQTLRLLAQVCRRKRLWFVD